MSDMIVTFPGGKKVNAEFDGYVVKTDQPEGAGGDDSAPTPFATFLASLATCAGIYVLGFCQNRNIPTEGVRLVQRIAPDPRTGGIGVIGIDIEVPPDFPAQYHEALVRVASQCAVKKTIENPPKFDVKTVVR